MKTSTAVLSVALAASVTLNVAAVGAFVVRRLTRAKRQSSEWVRRARPESREELRELYRELGRQLDSLRQELAGEQRGLANLLRGTETSEADVDSAVTRIGRLHTAMTRKAFDYTRQALQKLTPEQQELLLRRFERQYERRPHTGRSDRGGRRGKRDNGRGDRSSRRGQRDSEPQVRETPGDGR
jgi:chromosome segregation ATPase